MEKKQKVNFINVNDDELMIAERLRPAHITPKDKSVWVKTKAQKDFWKSLPKIKYCGWSAPKESIPAHGKLIIYSKTYQTVSVKCIISDIQELLSKYPDVIKFSWNGVTYPKYTHLSIR